MLFSLKNNTAPQIFPVAFYSRVKIRFLIGTGTTKGQLNVCRTGTAYRERTAGTVYWGHSVLSTGQAQRI